LTKEVKSTESGTWMKVRSMLDH